MFPEISVNKATPTESMNYLFEQIHVFIREKRWGAFFIYLGTAWEWRNESNEEVLSLFEQHLLSELKFLINTKSRSSLEQYCEEYLFSDPIKRTVDKNYEENNRYHVEMVMQYWLKHLSASNFLSPEFIYQCSKKYFFDTLLLMIRRESAFRDDLYPKPSGFRVGAEPRATTMYERVHADCDDGESNNPEDLREKGILDSLKADIDWTNLEESKFFLQSVISKVTNLPVLLITRLLHDFPEYRDFLLELVADHPYRFFLFKMVAENHLDLNLKKMVFKTWSQECQKDLKPFERALCDKMILEVAQTEAMQTPKQCLFSILIFLTPENHQTCVPVKSARSSLWPNFLFQRYIDYPPVSGELSSDYLAYIKEPAWSFIPSLCHEWVLMHIVARANLEVVDWGKIKNYDVALEANLKKRDFKEERGHFLHWCVTEKKSWQSFLIGEWFQLDQKRWAILSDFKRLDMMMSGALGSSLHEISQETRCLDHLLSEVKDALSSAAPLALEQLKKYSKTLSKYNNLLNLYLDILRCMHINIEPLMSSSDLREYQLFFAWKKYIGMEGVGFAPNLQTQAQLDCFNQYIPPPIQFKSQVSTLKVENTLRVAMSPRTLP